MNQVAQGLLGNPLFGLGVGLLSGGAPGGTFAGGAQQGLRNMMLMQAQNQRNTMQDLQTQRLQAQMAEEERQRVLAETMRAQGNPEWLGQAAQAAQPAEMAPYQQSGAEMFPGEQPIGGLMDVTQQAQPAQEATGLMAQNPQLGGMVEQMYQSNPVGTNQMLAKSLLDQRARPFGFNDYMNSSPEVQDQYNTFKGYGDDAGPAKLQIAEAYANMGPEGRRLFREANWTPQYLDRGTGFYNPNAAPDSPNIGPEDTAASAEQTGLPGVVEKDIIGKKIQEAEGGDVGKRLVSYKSDMAVAEDLVLSIEETQGQLAELFGMTSYDTTGVASFMNNLPASDARAWENMKTTLQSRMGLDKMMELKAGSATGSTGFGALNAKELELLVSNLGKLDQASDPNDIKRIMISINRQLGDKTKRIRAKMDSQRAWYEKNKHQLTQDNQVSDEGVVNWSDL